MPGLQFVSLQRGAGEEEDRAGAQQTGQTRQMLAEQGNMLDRVLEASGKNVQEGSRVLRSGLRDLSVRRARCCDGKTARSRHHRPT